MASEPGAVEQAVSRALRENLESIQNTSDELHRAVGDLVAACASNRALNALPPVVRAQMASASLSATLDVLVRLITAAIQPANRVPVDAEAFRLSSRPSPEPLTASNPPESRFAEPRIAEPKFVEPNFAAPNFAEATFTEHRPVKASGIETSVVEASHREPRYAEPKPTQPELREIRAEEARPAERTVVAPTAPEPKAPEAKVPEPKVVETKVAQPKSVEQKVPEPQPQVAAKVTVPVEVPAPAVPVQVVQVSAPEPIAPEVPVQPVAPKPPAAQPPKQSPVEAVIELVVEAVQHSGGLFAAQDAPATKIEPVTPFITQPTILPVTEPILQSVIQPVAVSSGTEDDSLWVPGPDLKAEFGATSLMGEGVAPLIPIGDSPEPAPESSAPEIFDITALPIDQQELHRRANRVAKVSMQDIKMLRPDDVRLGRENRDLCRRLRDDIEKAHKEYERRFQTINSHPVDYFYNWMVEILAGGNPEALGEYPYPSVLLHR
jgi:hypothetical protein